MGKNYTVYAMSEALSVLTHQKGTEGNESLVNTEPVATPGGIRQVPFLSANAIRHSFIRAVGAKYLIDKWELSGRLSLRQLNFLFHGGTLTDSTGRENTKRISEVNRLFPLIRLLGGSLPNQILSGSLKAWRGMLVCRENASRIGKCFSQFSNEYPTNLRPADTLIEKFQYTRGDSLKTVPTLVKQNETAEPAKKGDGSQMIYSGQSVVCGAVFLHGFILENVTDLEMGVFILSLRLWQAAGGTIGGYSRVGHGKVKTMLAGDLPENEDEIVSKYVAHVESSKVEGVKWLEDVFAFKPPKDKKPKSESKLFEDDEELTPRRRVMVV